ncbi:uncharacterized protein JCM6883_000072 [Sporobolomyces salmoneus]|uniref:uncharacterized protein n=1 Tax=Sporobolomyces salmoneus TaxID=183962 RepID=UPI0031763F71
MPPDKKVYPRPPAASHSESYAFRPSSPINQHPSGSPSSNSRSFFSRPSKPSKSTSQVTKIPWESTSTHPISPTASPKITATQRPSSPHSTHSYTSSQSSSAWSHNWDTFGSRRREMSEGSSPRDGFRNRRINLSQDVPAEEEGGWSDDEDDEPLSSSAGKKGSGGKRAMMRQAFKLEKKSSNFSLRGLIRRGGTGGRDSIDQDYFSPPPSPTHRSPPSMQRQLSSPELLKSSNTSISRGSPRLPLFPLPLSPPRERTISSPVFASPESAGVKGKAARLLGEEIVPHGKAARLLGVERKPTLRKRPSTASLLETPPRNDLARSHSSPRMSGLENLKFPDQVFDTPSSTRSLPLPPTNSSSTSTLSPQRSRHRHQESASDDFWRSDIAQQHQTALRANPFTLAEPIQEEDTPDSSPVVPFEPRFPRFGRISSPVPPSPPSDPTDSVYISDSNPRRSSLCSFSLDLNHLSTFSSNAGESPVENLASPTSSSVNSHQPRQTRRSTSSVERSPLRSSCFSYSPTTSSSPRGSISRISQQPRSTNIQHSTSMTAVTLGAPSLPAPSSALPPVPCSNDSSPQPSVTSAPLVQPSKPPPISPLPRIPSLDPMSSFLPLSKTHSKPTRSDTLVSVASMGTRRRQHIDALDALEGRRTGGRGGGDSNEKSVRAEEVERGSRKRAAEARQKNRAVRGQEGQEEENTKEKREEEEDFLEVEPKKREESFLDLDGSDDEGGGQNAVNSQVQRRIRTDGLADARERAQPTSILNPDPPRRDSMSSSRSSDASSLFSTLPMDDDVTASSFPPPPSCTFASSPSCLPLPISPAGPSRSLGLPTRNEEEGNRVNEKDSTTINLSLPSLTVTPASPSIPYDSDYVPFSLPDDDHSPASKEHDSPNLSDEKHDANASYDDIPLSSSSSTRQNPERESRRSSFPRFLHPEHLPPLFAPPLDGEPDRRRKRKRFLIRLFLVVAILSIAIGLGVGLSRPNRSATSEDLGGVAPSPSPRQGLEEATRQIAKVGSWTKLATSDPTSTLAPVNSTTSAPPPPLNTRPSTLGNPKGAGGGVQLHQRGAVVRHTGQRRTLRQFGQGTVAGWR